jgi:2-polyprenyl-3-methyl-5-hydroxy-6-metoxy-1,4-benzoquinol methylase
MDKLTYHNRARAEVLPFVPETAQTILEVGCGEGNFGNLLIQKGKRVWGIEPENTCIPLCEKKLTGIFSGTFLDYLAERDRHKMDPSTQPLLLQQFDCVVFNDVLEHLVDPWEALTASLSLLSPSGCIVSSIPNVRYYKVLKQLLFKKDWRYVEAGILDRTHLRFFTEKSILRLFHTCGYRVDVIQGINKSTTPVVSILNILLFNLLSGCLFHQYAIRAFPSGSPPEGGLFS